MNDVLRIARLKIALQRAFLGRAILIFTPTIEVLELRGRNRIHWESDFDVAVK